MIYYDGKIYRNLEEQVLKNQKDIEIYSAGGNFALKGIVADFEDLPESPQEGDYYLVGTNAPYDLFLNYNNTWVNLGEYPKEGPQGPQGIAGQNGATGATGPQGPKGDSLVYEILDIVPTTDDLPDPDSVDYWDAYLVGSGIPYMAYFVINGVWTPVGYITPQEAQNVVTADSANASSYKLMMSAQSGTRKIAESAWGITSTVVDAPNLIPSSQAVVSYVQNQVSAAVRFKGTVTFAQLSALASAEVGDLYNISDSFTLSGVSYDAGTNLTCVTAFSSVITPSSTYWDAYGEAAIDLSPYMKSYTGDPTQWDTTPTAASTKPVTSGGIKSAMDDALSDYAEIGTDPGFSYIHLYEQTESHQEQGEDAVIENVNGNLYFNGDPVGGGGGGGIQNTATGTNALAINAAGNANGPGTNSIIIGGSSYSTLTVGSNNICVGNDTFAGNSVNDSYNIVIGPSASSSMGTKNSVVIGRSASATNGSSQCVVIGSGSTGSANAQAYGANNSVTIGNTLRTHRADAINIGSNNTVYSGIVLGKNISGNGDAENIVIGNYASAGYFSVASGVQRSVAIGSTTAKTVDHSDSLFFNRCRFIFMTKSDSYTLASTMHGMTLTSTGVTYYAPSSTVTTGSSESALLICWYTD